MATAFLPLSNLFASINALLAWFAPRPAPVPCVAVCTAPQRPALCQGTIKPLRVVRVLEPATSRAAAGRMVISGRLADVCAELDRLAAQEARSQ
jgi:hypothetical protein